MHGTLVIAPQDNAAPTVTADPATGQITDALTSRDVFWLDLAAVDDESLTLLRDTFRFHPLAVEDAEQFGQRPKIDAYDDFTLLVAFELLSDGTPIEVHFFCTDRFVVTVHRAATPRLSATLARVTGSAAPGNPVTGSASPGNASTAHTAVLAPTMLLHRLLDGMVDSYLPVLDAMDEEIDALEDSILRRPTDEQLRTLFGLKRRLATVRRLAAEQRDMLGATLTDDDALPGMTPEAAHYFRDLYDHLIRISQTADSYRDLLSSVLDTHLSTTSNRLNVVMKQMTIIATVFLPLTFLTGFYGQNFAWMIDRIGGAWVFWIAGVGLQLAIAIALWVMFRRKGWLSSEAA